MERKRNMLLFVVGILMIIGGAIGIIVGLGAVACTAALGSLLSEAEVSAGGATAWLTIASVLILAGGAIELVAGILGVANANKPEKAQTCIVFGFLVIAIGVLSQILTLVGGGSFDFLTLLSSVAVPALYLIGAFQSKKLA